MKKHLSFGVIILLTTLLTACGGTSSNTPASKESSKKPTNTSSAQPTTSKGPVKGVSDLSISLRNKGDKAYITVSGTQQNYTADEFKWAWGIADQSGVFADGKSSPAAEDFAKVEFDSSNQFSVDYCLTDIATLKAGTLYQIYGGTPESYSYIPFATNMFGASDATRKYYLRQDQNNDLIFENVQPFKYDQASVVEVKQEDLPEGVTAVGAYLKFGAKNEKNVTIETINGWHEAGNIAGNFQRVIPSWQSHEHVDTERFWKIEDNYIYFYLFVGFIEESEGWMVHFDLVSGNSGAGLQLTKTVWGETPYKVGDITYRVYADTSKGTEEEYWGCLGVYRDAAQQ